MPKNEKGVTLLELMVALVITALLGMAIYNVCKMAMDAWQKGEARIQVYQNLRITLDKMSEEIRSATTPYSVYNPGDDVYFYGQSNKLDFISIAHAPIGNYYNSDFTTGDLVFDCCEIGYKVSGTTIYRRKYEINVPDSDITAGGLWKEMITDGNLGFRYSPDDGTTWLGTWDAETKSPKGKLPNIVEIGITARSTSTRYPSERTFSTYVYLPAR